MIVASFGGGVNSTAMLIGMVERGERCDLILFADTGGEKPHTYEHIERFSKWLQFVGMPPIQTVKKVRQSGAIHALEEDCLEKHMLPSIAYGFKTCSQKFKIQPQDKYCNNLVACKAAWAAGEKVIKLIGYDMDEPHRTVKLYDDDKYSFRYPLIEWNWGREECVEAIMRAGQRVPDKSACFFCPSSKKSEIMELRRIYPDLAKRAVAMEQNAQLTSVKGLGRSFAWGDLYAADDNQAKLFPESPIDIDCGCYDGEAA